MVEWAYNRLSVTDLDVEHPHHATRSGGCLCIKALENNHREFCKALLPGLRQSPIQGGYIIDFVTLSRSEESVSRSERSFTAVQDDTFHDFDGALLAHSSRGCTPSLRRIMQSTHVYRHSSSNAEHISNGLW